LISLAAYLLTYTVGLLVLEYVVNKRVVSPVIDLTLRIRRPKEMSEGMIFVKTSQSSGHLSGTSNHFDRSEPNLSSSRGFLSRNQNKSALSFPASQSNTNQSSVTRSGARKEIFKSGAEKAV
jgi:hypothetical protein